MPQGHEDKPRADRDDRPNPSPTSHLIPTGLAEVIAISPLDEHGQYSCYESAHERGTPTLLDVVPCVPKDAPPAEPGQRSAGLWGSDIGPRRGGHARSLRLG